MNYRHAFHAGNFADCMKHALLLCLAGLMQNKPAGVLFLDTHAGIGRYDLAGAEAVRGAEWQAGIGRLLAEPPAPLADYVAAVERLGLYPGSPALLRALLRVADRLCCCELHEADHATLRRAFAHDPHVAIHHRDGWEALSALLPASAHWPGLKRALVLIDPPYETGDEFIRATRGIATARRHQPNAVVACWYPLKHRAPVRAFHQALSDAGERDLLAAELWLRPPLDPARLNGCGLIVASPPYGFEAEAAPILAALAARLGEEGHGYAIERLTPE